MNFLRPRRQLPDEITLNQQFFDNLFQSSRISRDTDDGEPAPTIALHDLISSVEHTLIHSAQNLALSDFTSNLTATIAESTATNNTSHIDEIVLPISVPTPSTPVPEEISTEAEGLTTVTDEDLIRDHRSSDETVTHIVTDFESVKPIENSNLGILFPISLNPSANISRVVADEESEHDAVTEPADPKNITVHHTINATQLIPTETDVVHLHQQQITFFSANAGVFPNIHAVHAADLPQIAQNQESSTAQSEDCSGEETSDESKESSSEEDSSSESSSSSSEETDKVKKSGCTVKSSSVASSKPTESTTPSVEAIKKLKTEELKEQIAEVEADPVILTQGI